MRRKQQVAAEFSGTALLVAAVIGSGIMASKLSSGNDALALLGNTIPTAAILVVSITMLAPISGAHFNPAVTTVFWLRREIATSLALEYIGAQVAGAIAGVLAAHAMFDVPLFELSGKIRSGPALWFSECVATFGLLMTILATRAAKPNAVPVSVGLYITAAYWFTASTSFANPAVTLARAFSDTFAGIRVEDVPAFVIFQFVGALGALIFCNWLLSETEA